ncbi:putative membrane protein [Pacificibacter maritimus]|uniref:Putative membrane protein n=1 Tax=Pacificibacter maritimus TaxID=762213 RepID=A0A3N4V444_9RHOB|nr:DUF2306 domain-containing protein [Pacificibacter maritimus]RPE71887.1 putative membrane protein [Pacificibacter maritimus]
MISFDPLLTAPFAIQIHVASATLSLILIPPVLWRVRRDGLHKTLGYVWITAMVVTALSSFWISEIKTFGHFSPLHLLAVLSLVTMALAIWFVVNGNIRAHKKALQNLSTFGLGIPSVLNFLPDRRLSDTFFSANPMLGLGLSASIIAMILFWRSGVVGKLMRFTRGGILRDTKA